MQSYTDSSPMEQNGADLSEVLAEARKRGFDQTFGIAMDMLHATDSNVHYGADQVRIEETISIDMGTDPGDESTVYLLRTNDDRRGFLVVPASIYADAEKAAFIDRLRADHDKTANA